MTDRLPLSTTVTAGLADWQIVQQIGGQASITLQGTWHAPDATSQPEVYVRVVHEADGGVILPWQPCRMIDGHGWQVTLTLQAGGLYRVETALQLGAAQPVDAIRGQTIHHVGAGDLWVIAGGSTMGGVGRPVPYNPPELGIHLLRAEGAWDLATHPLNEAVGPINIANHDLPTSGHSPFLAWARTVREVLHYPIGLIQTGRDGASLHGWAPHDGELWSTVVAAAERAGGTLKGILWNGGEADANSAAAGWYRERFVATVAAWRRALGDDRLPVLTVQANRYAGTVEKLCDDRAWSTLREAQRRLATEIADVAVVPSHDCPLSDNIHLSPAGNLIVGARLAQAALGDVYGCRRPVRAPEAIRATLDQATASIVVRCAHVHGYLVVVGLQAGAFVVEDVQGTIAVEQWAVTAADTVRLRLAQLPTGEVLVHGSYGHNPLGSLPIDTATYLPMLAFADLQVQTPTIPA